jgi:hypothetical protein
VIWPILISKFKKEKFIPVKIKIIELFKKLTIFEDFMYTRLISEFFPILSEELQTVQNENKKKYEDEIYFKSTFEYKLIINILDFINCLLDKKSVNKRLSYLSNNCLKTYELCYLFFSFLDSKLPNEYNVLTIEIFEKLILYDVDSTFLFLMEVQNIIEKKNISFDHEFFNDIVFLNNPNIKFSKSSLIECFNVNLNILLKNF